MLGEKTGGTGKKPETLGYLLKTDRKTLLLGFLRTVGLLHFFGLLLGI